MKVDEKTLVPVGWVLGGFVTVITIVVIGAFWVSAVDYRLSRIEEKLGIPAYRAGQTVLPAEAEAGGQHGKHN